MFMGFTICFYIIFETDLLTGGLARIAVFFAYFSVSKKRNIKRSPNGMKPSGAWFLERTRSGELGVQVKKLPRTPRDRGRALPSRGRLGCFLTCTPSPLDHVRSKNHAPEGFIPFGLHLIFLCFEGKVDFCNKYMSSFIWLMRVSIWMFSCYFESFGSEHSCHNK